MKEIVELEKGSNSRLGGGIEMELNVKLIIIAVACSISISNFLSFSLTHNSTSLALLFNFVQFFLSLFCALSYTLYFNLCGYSFFYFKFKQLNVE
jgi:hypothetical protein